MANKSQWPCKRERAEIDHKINLRGSIKYCVEYGIKIGAEEDYVYDENIGFEVRIERFNQKDAVKYIMEALKEGGHLG